MKDDYFSGSDVLNQSIFDGALTSLKLLPRVNRLVAYNKKDNAAIGFLCITETTNQLFTIEKVFVHPNSRRMGIATHLINHAIVLAREKGSKKVNLNVYTTNTNAIKLYKELGFREIGKNLLGQGFLSDYAPLKIAKRVIKGQGSLTKLALEKGSKLVELQIDSEKNRDKLFNIYEGCVKREWLDFFEINSENLICGSRHAWQPAFYKEVLVNDQANFFTLIYHKPFSSKATIEVYSTSETITPIMLDNLLKILRNMGISFAQILCFNESAVSWFEKSGIHLLNGMMTFEFVTMGLNL